MTGETTMKGRLRRLWLFFGILGLVLGAPKGEAQSVMAPPASGPLLPAMLKNETGGKEPGKSASPTGITNQPSLFKWGPIELTPSFDNRFLYSDGMLTRPGHASNTYINTLTAVFNIQIGSHLVLEYTPTWVVYTNKEYHNSFNNALRLAGAQGFSGKDWSLQVSQSYVPSFDTRVETGRQTKQQTVSTGISVGYRVTDKIRLESNNSQNLQFIEAANDVFSWATQNWLVYQVSSRLNVAVGGGAGYDQTYHSPDMYFVRPGARVNLKASDKVAVSLSWNADRRTSLGHRSRTLKSPVLDASINYQPFETTTLSLSGSRGVSATYFENTATVNEQWSLSLEQRLFKYFNLSATVSTGKAKYEPTVTGASLGAGSPDLSPVAGRNDSQRAYSVNLGTMLFHHLSISVFYQYSHNSSSLDRFGFSGHQIGCQTGYRF